MALLDNLISYWKLDEASGSALDSHGSYNLSQNGTIGTRAGKIGSARNLVRTSSHRFQIADTADFRVADRDFSFSCWIYRDVNSQFQTVCSKSNAGQTIGFACWFDTSNVLRFRILGATYVSGTVTGLSTATWYHLVVTHNVTEKRSRVYINGGAAVESIYTGSGSDDASMFRIGSFETSSHFDGAIDEFSFWHRELTSAEVGELYNSGDGLAYEVIAAAPPVFTTQPINRTIKNTANTSFSVSVTGVPTPTLQWQVDDGGGWADLVGETNSTLSITSATLAMDGYLYRCVGTNASGTVNSSSATLTVIANNFPSIVQHTIGVTNPASTSHTVPLGGTATIGNLLLVVFYPRNFVWQPAPAGFQPIVWENDTEAVNVYAKVSDGTETGVTFTTASTLASWAIFEVSDWSGNLSSGFVDGKPLDRGGLLGTFIPGGGTSTTPNPPNLNPAIYEWADTDTLWIALFLLTQGNRTVSAIPTNYTDLGYAGAGTTSGVAIGAAYRQLNASSEDPGPWTISASTDWGAWTFGIRSADSPSHPTDITQFLSEVGYSAEDKTVDITQFLSEVGYSANTKNVDITQYLSEVGYSADDKTVDVTQFLIEVAYVPGANNSDWYFRILRRDDDMTLVLKQSTASQTVVIGPFIDDTDFKTPETALTIANTDVKLSKNGAAAVDKNSDGATHLINGEYAITLDATDTSAVGELRISVVVAGALPVIRTFQVVEEVVFDALYAIDAPGFTSVTNETTINNIENILNEITGDTFNSTTMNLEEIYNIVNENNTYIEEIRGGSFDLATDSLENIFNTLIAMSGVTFDGSTDSLENIYNTVANIPASGEERTISRAGRPDVTYTETIVPPGP